MGVLGIQACSAETLPSIRHSLRVQLLLHVLAAAVQQLHALVQPPKPPRAILPARCHDLRRRRQTLYSGIADPGRGVTAGSPVPTIVTVP